MARHCYVLRVFTRDDSGGNSLGVITDILGLDDQKMQQIATDLGFSETIFLSWFDGVMPKARIFTPTLELPFAGHPLVGAAWILINLGPVDPGAIECSVGTVRIRQDDGITWIDGAGGQPARTMPAGSGPNFPDSNGGSLDVAEVLMPSPYLLVQVARPDDVAAVDPSMMSGFGNVYVWAWDEEGESVRSRFFAPGFGVSEDPATGSAAFALAARLRDLGRERGNLVICQGQEIGHPSRINLVWDELGTSIGGTVARDEVRFLKI